MAEGYEVLLTEVLAASRVFGRESQVLGTLDLPGTGEDANGVYVPGSVPDGGDSVLDAALSDVLQAAGMATSQLAAVIGAHARKLQECYDRYRDVEETNSQLMYQLLGVMGGSS